MAIRSSKIARALATIAGTIVGNLFLAVGTLALSSLALAVAVVPPRGHWTYRVARLWGRCVLAFAFVRLQVEGEGELPREGRYVFMANHSSLFDIVALLAAIPRQTRFLAKRSLFQIPVFGWAIRAGGFIPVDRGDRSRARESFVSALDRLGHGTSVLLFPEETRSHDGNLLPFRKGGFLLAMKSGLAVVPVGIEGALAVQPRASFAIHPGTISIRFGRPIEVAGRSVKELPALVDATRRAVARLARVGLAGADSSGAEPVAADEKGALA